jgi:hypothetical protein|eukprot:COSAG01_NODE_2739_length_7159_cov_15.443343_9_plen_34_part_00
MGLTVQKMAEKNARIAIAAFELWREQGQLKRKA